MSHFRHTRFQVCAGLVSGIFVSGCMQKSIGTSVPANHGPPSSAISDTVTLNSRLTFKAVDPKANPFGLVEGIALYSFYAYDKVSCDADWNQNCEQELELSAPDGFQVCNVIYTVESQLGNASADYAFTGGKPFPDDHEPFKYKNIRLSVHAQGNSEFWDKGSGSIHLKNVGLTILPADKDVKVRIANHCRFHPGSCLAQCCPETVAGFSSSFVCPTIPKEECFTQPETIGELIKGSTFCFDPYAPGMIPPLR